MVDFETSQNQKMEPDKIIILVYMLFNSILGCLFNLVVLLVYFKYSKNYPSVILLSLLALSNFLCSIIVMPIVIITELDIIQKDNMYCGIYYLIRYLFASLTIVLLALIAFECLESIKNPIKVEISFKTKVLNNMNYYLDTVTFIDKAFPILSISINPVNYRYKITF